MNLYKKATYAGKTKVANGFRLDLYTGRMVDEDEIIRLMTLGFYDKNGEILEEKEFNDLMRKNGFKKIKTKETITIYRST